MWLRPPGSWHLHQDAGPWSSSVTDGTCSSAWISVSCRRGIMKGTLWESKRLSHPTLPMVLTCWRSALGALQKGRETGFMRNDDRYDPNQFRIIGLTGALSTNLRGQSWGSGYPNVEGGGARTRRHENRRQARVLEMANQLPLTRSWNWGDCTGHQLVEQRTGDTLGHNLQAG
jgi:hypothetical protein